MSWTWIAAAFGFAVVDWYFVAVGNQKWRWVTKLFVILALLAGLTLAGGWHGRTQWFGLGLLCCLVGDVFMLLPAKLFPGAVLTFLPGYILYSFGFIQGTTVSKDSMTITIIGAVMIAVLDYFGFSQLQSALLKRPGQRWLRIPCFIYQLGISLMVLSALYSLQDPALPVLAGWIFMPGAILLFISDGLLAYNRFVRSIPHARLIVTITYQIGQIALIAGAMMRG